MFTLNKPGDFKGPGVRKTQCLIIAEASIIPPPDRYVRLRAPHASLNFSPGNTNTYPGHSVEEVQKISRQVGGDQDCQTMSRLTIICDSYGNAVCVAADATSARAVCQLFLKYAVV